MSGGPLIEINELYNNESSFYDYSVIGVNSS